MAGVLSRKIRAFSNKTKGVLSKQLGGRTPSATDADGISRTDREAQDVLMPLINDPPAPNALATVLVFADGNGATQRISFELPLEGPRKAGLVRLVMLSESDFDQGSPIVANQRAAKAIHDLDPTHVIVSRFGGQGATGIIKACQERNQSFIMHLDDNLFSVPEAVGQSKSEKYQNPGRRSRLRLLCERASKVYASTAELARQLVEMGISTPVKAGRIYCAGLGEGVPFRERAEPIIGYMGTSGHAADLEAIVPTIRSIMNHNPAVSFETFGSIKMPRLLQKVFPDRVQAHSATSSYQEFLDKFADMGWTCGLAPLEDNKFNACKANTKYIEYSQAGIPCIASASAVYNDTIIEGAGILAHSVDDWREGIIKIIKNQKLAADMVELAQKNIAQDWSQSGLLAQLIEIAELPEAIGAYAGKGTE